MKHILFFIFGLGLTYNTFAQNFTREEIQLITKGDPTAPMKVIQSTDKDELNILTRPSQDISWDDPMLSTLKDRMYQAMRNPENEGIGIAAPQVGINRNAIWVQRFDKKDEPFEFYINPKIIWYSELKQLGPEGCLSIPDIRGDVMRSYTIMLTYQTEDGAKHTEIIEDFTAVVFQHEFDHLLGILFTKRLDEQKKIPYTPIQDSNKKLFINK